MQTLVNIVFGAMLAGASLGPTLWSDVARIDARLSQAAAVLMGMQEQGTPLDSALAKARSALPGGAH
jgi:hypothetical protein